MFKYNGFKYAGQFRVEDIRVNCFIDTGVVISRVSQSTLDELVESGIHVIDTGCVISLESRSDAKLYVLKDVNMDYICIPYMFVAVCNESGTEFLIGPEVFSACYNSHDFYNVIMLRFSNDVYTGNIKGLLKSFNVSSNNLEQFGIKFDDSLSELASMANRGVDDEKSMYALAVLLRR